MRLLHLLPAALLAVSACDVTSLGPVDTGPVAMTPFTWKGNTPRDVRAYDINECELAGRGLPPNATAEQIAAASGTANDVQVAKFVNRCLTNKGYIVTEKPVCTEADQNAGEFVQGANIMPPLNRIKCIDPARRGMIVV
ncbi:hypothetical protein [Halovulum sp. GXIMD14793]